MECSLYEWLGIWMKEYKENFVKEVTGEGYYYIIDLIKANQEDKPLADFIEMDFQILVQKLYLKKFSRSTIRKVCYILKASFNCAVRNKMLCENVANALQVPKDAAVKEVNALSKDDQKKVEEFCARHTLGHLIIFLLHTGLRRKELINLKWSDYDKNKNCIYVRESKTKGWPVDPCQPAGL